MHKTAAAGRQTALLCNALILNQFRNVENFQMVFSKACTEIFSSLKNQLTKIWPELLSIPSRSLIRQLFLPLHLHISSCVNLGFQTSWEVTASHIPFGSASAHSPCFLWSVLDKFGYCRQKLVGHILNARQRSARPHVLHHIWQVLGRTSSHCCIQVANGNEKKGKHPQVRSVWLSGLETMILKADPENFHSCTTEPFL